MNTINLKLINKANQDLKNISLSDLKKFEVKIDDIPTLVPTQAFQAKLHIDFQGKSEKINFNVSVSGREYPVTLAPDVGELVRKHLISQEEFDKQQKKLSGMNESSVQASVKDVDSIASRVLGILNVAALAQKDDSIYRFSGQKLHDNSVLLVTIQLLDAASGKVKIIVNCDDFVLNGQLADVIKRALAN